MEIIEPAVMFAALSQQTRIRLIRLLAAEGGIGLSAGALAARIGIPPSTLSFHLAALEHAGLLRATRRGRQLIYAVHAPGVRGLLRAVAEACCGGRPELPADEEDDMSGSTAPAFNVLFLCTHNSARSLMAEALLERVGKRRFNAYSAGSEPLAPLPEVIDKLAAFGHDVSRLRSKSWDEFVRPEAPRMDFIIALCDTPQGQQCPDFGDRAITGAWPLPDPRKFVGSPAERAVLLSELYAGIRRRLDAFCSLPFTTLDRIAAKARLDLIGTPDLLAA
jgi:ArsR family transcriptional regulator, arsenate/arsenite/antimonite-responsive transcriptional repressor / arsenate reductase (thioredoxin)